MLLMVQKEKDEDTCAVTSMFKDYLDVTVSNTKCFQIGKKHDEPCLLKPWSAHLMRK